MKGTFSFFAFILLLAIMLVMPPGRSDTNKEQPVNTEFADIVQPDLNVILYSPIVLEVADNPSAICTGELWVYTIGAINDNEDVGSQWQLNELYKDKTLLTNENSLNANSNNSFAYGLRRTC